ncbi:uncharacterized protein L3040_004662 [Drepanopeziza brunnea f. sp. 'multigermtubi']|uniref:uncharacterized protein n=1 Tax=Drepanopeziza brunnea f. sp. 'multigermtubi' TaxID=698441 RepID=UPI002382CC28|nr:hypothetical protein L3040_004662 [Drepanopeziza brunnea f. sp. 'multigermtubi']
MAPQNDPEPILISTHVDPATTSTLDLSPAHKPLQHQCSAECLSPDALTQLTEVSKRLEITASSKVSESETKTTGTAIREQCKEFKLFPRLASELRLMIWTAAMGVEPRIVLQYAPYKTNIFWGMDACPNLALGIPVLFHICSEAREVAIKGYEFIQGHETFSSEVDKVINVRRFPPPPIIAAAASSSPADLKCLSGALSNHPAVEVPSKSSESGPSNAVAPSTPVSEYKCWDTKVFLPPFYFNVDHDIFVTIDFHQPLEDGSTIALGFRPFLPHQIHKEMRFMAITPAFGDWFEVDAAGVWKKLLEEEDPSIDVLTSRFPALETLYVIHKAGKFYTGRRPTLVEDLSDGALTAAWKTVVEDARKLNGGWKPPQMKFVRLDFV